MDRANVPSNCDVWQEDAFWNSCGPEHAADRNGPVTDARLVPALESPVTGSMGRAEHSPSASWGVWTNLQAFMQQDALAQRSIMTVSEFVEHIFVPRHVTPKRYSCRMHCQAMLKHVLTPEKVNRLFKGEKGPSKVVLKTIQDWPYMDNLRLCDVRPKDTQQILEAALARGYSIQTVKHIRSVISNIFSCAEQEHCFNCGNPARQVNLPGSPRKEPYFLEPAHAKEALGIMKSPEREMMFLLVFTGMNVSEICGLQWKQVNLTEKRLGIGGEAIPPKTIAVRKQWYRGELESVKESRSRYLPIPQPLLQVLLRLGERKNFTGQDDFVLVSRMGTPINQGNLVRRRLRQIAKKIGIPSLSWQVILRTRKVMASEVGNQYQILMAMNANPPRILGGENSKQTWHCRRLVSRPNLH